MLAQVAGGAKCLCSAGYKGYVVASIRVPPPLLEARGPSTMFFGLVWTHRSPPYIIIYAKRESSPLSAATTGQTHSKRSPLESTRVHFESTLGSYYWTNTFKAQSTRVHSSPLSATTIGHSHPKRSPTKNGDPDFHKRPPTSKSEDPRPSKTQVN